ncbi:hypothetical protein MGSAQ_000382 [marine sediment metagenome]|uniref:Uncharacterized protein n=1 Tax=marine sediment metagenome TaxID=412755 RepID=A0A1B6NYN0_9ZZZZ
MFIRIAFDIKFNILIIFEILTDIINILIADMTLIGPWVHGKAFNS